MASGGKMSWRDGGKAIDIIASSVSPSESLGANLPDSKRYRVKADDLGSNTRRHQTPAIFGCGMASQLQWRDMFQRQRSARLQAADVRRRQLQSSVFRLCLNIRNDSFNQNMGLLTSQLLALHSENFPRADARRQLCRRTSAKDQKIGSVSID